MHHTFEVPMKYKNKTRIGNWSEEWELEQTLSKDYQARKNNGQLVSDKLQQKLNHSLQKASLTYQQDGLLHFNDHMMIFNHFMGSFLVTNIWERVSTQNESYQVTSTQNIVPCTRSIFVLQRFEKDLFQDNIIHFGQKILLQANPRLIKNKQLYLTSGHVTQLRCAKQSRQQEVSITTQNTFENVWVIEHADPKLRYEMQGQPVQVGQPILIKHQFTGQWLASDKYNVKNDFGQEFEVFGHSFQSVNKTRNLIAEKTGRTTIDITLRNQQDQNLFSIYGANDPSEEFDEALLEKAVTYQDIVNQIRANLYDRGQFGFRALGKIFSQLDEENRGVLEQENIKWGFRNAGIFLNQEELNLIYEQHTNKNGFIEYKKLMNQLRPRLSEERHNLINRVYQKLIRISNDNLTLEQIGQQFEPARHYEVLKKLKTEQQLFKEFIANWNTEKADENIKYDEFLEYFTDFSAAIEKDEQFQQTLLGCFNLAQ